MGLHTELSIYKAAYDLFDVVTDLARDSDDLKRKNAELRRQLAETQSLLDVVRETGIAQAARLQQFERLLDALHDGAKDRSSQPLARWVKYGPAAELLAGLMKTREES